MIDGEGSVVIGQRHGRYVKVASTDQELVDALLEALALFGIEGRVRTTPRQRPEWRDLHNVVIERRALVQQLGEVVDLQHPGKAQRLETILAFEGTPPGAHNAAKTHCPHGHAYDEKNTYVHNGQRFCRACNRSRTRRRIAA
jgi:hypothetical protein